MLGEIVAKKTFFVVVALVSVPRLMQAICLFSLDHSLSFMLEF